MMTSAEMWFGELAGVWKGEGLHSVHIKGGFKCVSVSEYAPFFLAVASQVVCLTILKYIKSELFGSIWKNKLPFRPAERQEKKRH